MVVIAKLNRLGRRLPVVHKCRHILQRLGNPTLLTAQNWLERLGSSDDSVWKGEKCLPVWKLIKSMSQSQHAFLVPIRFVGGPPKGRGLLGVYQGTLYTFLLDRILYYVEEVGLAAAEDALGILRKV